MSKRASLGTATGWVPPPNQPNATVDAEYVLEAWDDNHRVIVPLDQHEALELLRHAIADLHHNARTEAGE